MPSFFDQLPSARGGGFFAQLPSQQGIDPIEEGLRQARANAVYQASRAVQQGDTQFARDILMPFGITSEPERGRTTRQSTPRVIGSADRGYSAFNPDTGQVEEILPGRQGMLSDIDKARVRMVSDERSQILKSLNELPPTHASRPALETRLAEVEESLKQVFGGGQAPQQAPQRAPAPRNQVFMGGQTALTPEDVAQLEAAESGYFGPGAGLNSALPPVGSSVPPPDYPFPSGDQINDALMAPAATQPTGFFDTLQGNAANRLAPVGQNLRNLPSTVGGNVRESFQNFRRNIGFPVEQPATNAPAIRNIRRIR